MPWKTSDVAGKTKAAKSATAKRQWVHVANNALSRGLSEGAAIREANAAVARRGKKKRSAG
jgi:hypothetical protein